MSLVLLAGVAAACGSGPEGGGTAPSTGLAAPGATIGSSPAEPGTGTEPGANPGTAPTSAAPTSAAPTSAAPTSAAPTSDGVTSDGVTELASRPLPTSAAELAAELSTVEAELGRPGIDEVSARPWGRRQQLLYRILSANPDWADTVLGAVDPGVVEIVELNWEARRSLSGLLRSASIATTLPAWEIRAPLPADELIGYYKEASAATGIPWTVLAAINLIETRMGRIEGVSTAGAVGPMQFLPTTWAECCTGDPTVDRDAILGAARYLIDRGAERSLERAVFGYNNSDNYVTAVLAHAAVLDRDEGRYYGYHAWEVVFLSTAGLVRLPEGYRQSEAVDAATWVAANPELLVTGAN